MFDALSDRLRTTLANLTGRGRVSEADVDTAMREVRLALLEADVNFKVVKDFVARVRERAIGADILESLTAGQQVVEASSTRSSPRSCRPATAASTCRATRPSSCSSASRARARRRPRPSSPGYIVKRAAGRCSSPPTRTARPPPTSSRRSARRSTSRSIAPRPARPSSTSRRAASRPPAAWPATSSSSTRPAA